MLGDLDLMKVGYKAICASKDEAIHGNVLRRATRIFLDDYGFRDRRANNGAKFTHDAVYLALLAIDKM